MKIKDLVKKYKNQWILVEVMKETPDHQLLEVKVLSCSKEREEIYDALVKMAKKSKKHLATIFTGRILKEGYAAAFFYGQKKRT